MFIRIVSFLVIIVWLGWFVWLSQYNEKQALLQEEISQLIVEQEQFDTELNLTDQELLDGAVEWATLEQQLVFSGVMEWADIHQLEQAFDQASGEWDIARQLRVLEMMYQQRNDISLLPVLIELALAERMYDKALEYVAVLEEQNMLIWYIDQSRIFDLLFNWLDLNFKDIERIKRLMLYYVDQWYVGTWDELLYSSLITLVRWDMENYVYYIEQLEDSIYGNRYTQHLQDVAIVETFPDVSWLYLEMLTALHVFHEWWYQVAKVIAERWIKQNDEYILPRQIHAYSSLLLKDVADARSSLEWLMLYDEQHAELYSFLLWVVNFVSWAYPDAILVLQWVSDSLYEADVLRYLLLSYAEIEDWDSVAVNAEQLLSQDDVTRFDFYTVFDLFFYQPLRQWWSLELYTTYSDIADLYIQQCYQDIDDRYAYICLYGKAGRLLVEGKTDKAYNYLERLVKWYPTAFMFEVLWDISYQQKDYEQAKKRFIQAVGSPQIDSTENELMKKIRQTMTQK